VCLCARAAYCLAEADEIEYFFPGGNDEDAATGVEGHRTKSELGVHVLRKSIRTGELVPGTRLNTDDLKDDLVMISTPIREALRMLQPDGLVSCRSRQGIV
jgi:DNA-binding GntR family transcriptional regulator